MVHLAKDGFSAHLSHDGKWVSIQVDLQQPGAGPLEFSCTLDNLSSVLSACTLQVSSARGEFLLMQSNAGTVAITAATIDNRVSVSCEVPSDEFAALLRQLRGKNTSANGAVGL